MQILGCKPITHTKPKEGINTLQWGRQTGDEMPHANLPRKVKRCTVLFSVVMMGWLNVSNGKTLFFEDFEGDLSQWVGKSGGIHHGKIVDDPLGADHALTFTALNGAGDIFSTLINNPSGKYILSFDYLGLRKPGSIYDDFGGFIGYSYGTPGSHYWIGGTQAGYGPVHLLDTEQWEHFTFEFNASTNLRVMLEDFSGSGGVTGDALFDNIRLTDAEGPNLVTLTSFTATPTETGIRIDWETSAETNTAGFRVWRGELLTGGQCTRNSADYGKVVRLNFDSARGDLQSGASYSRTDGNVTSQTTYCYLLEDVEFDGDQKFHWDLMKSVTAK